MMHTRACERLGIVHPIVQAGMSRVYTSPELVAAVSAAGGLGILGCLGRTASEAVAAIRRIRALTDRPFGVNFVLHLPHAETFAACLAERVPVFSFFRGDPAEAVARAHDAGAVTLHQVTTVAEAEHACAAGVDVLVAQGTEAGGHMGPVPLWSLLPAIVAVADRPVLAAGGIVDGRGLAAALCLGAEGVLMGTRFLATPEAPVSTVFKQAILQAVGPDATVASGIFDILWGMEWPGVQARALRNRFTARWVSHDDELRAARDGALAATQAAEGSGDASGFIVLAGMGAGRIHELQPAAQIVHEVIVEATTILREWGAQATGE